MNTLRRSSLNVKIRLESLEDRITPVAFDFSAPAAALLAHTNVIIERNAPEPLSNPAGHKNHLRHHLHKTHVGRIVPLADFVSANTTPVSYQPAVLFSTKPTAGAAVAISTDAPGGGGAILTDTTNGALPSRPTITAPVTPPMPLNLAAPLAALYGEYQATHGNGPFNSPAGIDVEGSSVKVQIFARGGSIDALLADMDNLGFQPQSPDSTTDPLVGLIPIGALVKAAEDPLALSVIPVLIPNLQQFGSL